MKRWEYRITRIRVEDFTQKMGEAPEPAFTCDQKGQCFLHDAQSAAGMIGEAFNEEGLQGWELVQFGYHLGELMCVWKRAVE